MIGRAAIIAAGSLLVHGAAQAQTSPPAGTPNGADSAGAVAQSASAPRPLAAEPDPLTPPEVQGPPPSAPLPVATVVPSQPSAAQVDAAAATAAPAQPATPVTAAAPQPDSSMNAIRSRLAALPARVGGIDPADRAALQQHYESANASAIWTNSNGLTARGRAVSAEIAKADDWGLKASQFDLPALPEQGSTDEQRADAEIKLGLAALKYARHARGGRLNPSSISAMLDRKPQVYDPKTLIAALAVASAPDTYLRALHPKHPGFVNLQKALVAARAAPAQPVPEPEAAVEPAPDKGKKGRTAQRKPAKPPTNAEMIQRIVVNMERWRWMPDDLGDFHVWNNVPDQITAVYKAGKVVFTERIVVGKPETPTPNFTANMQFVIFQPEWGVPGGIKNNEIAPLLRRASADSGGWFSSSNRTPSSVLARHGLRVSHGNQVVNPDSIDWTKVDVNRFNFIQPAGATNVLGVVKFRFPNKHDVYMHDTPQKHLFGSSTRAFSHGCMRVQNPVRFAEVLLEHDKGLSPEQVRAMVPRGTNVTLSKEIPVHNVYFTAIADETGKVRIAGDLYGIDSRVASALEGRSVSVASRGEPVAGGPAARQDQAVRQAKKKTPPGQSTASSGYSNPFAGLFGN